MVQFSYHFYVTGQPGQESFTGMYRSFLCRFHTFNLVAATLLGCFIAAGLSPVAAQVAPPATAPPTATPAPGTALPGTPGQGVPSATDAIAGPIRTADTLRVVVAGAEQLGGDFRVDADGTVFIPRLGQIKVEKKMQADAAKIIAKSLQDKKLLKKADVAVYIIARKQREVTINGAVTYQGRQPIKDASVLSEILEASVPSPAADLSRVTLARNGKETLVDYKRYRNGESSDTKFNPPLEDGDRIYVYSSAPGEGTVRLTGEVKDSTKILLPISAGTTVGQVLQAAGGLTEYADRNGILVVRGEERISVPYDDILKGIAGKDIPLKDKDIVTVPRLERPRAFTVAGAVRDARQFQLLTKVTLLDAVAQAGGTQEGARQDQVELRRRTTGGEVVTRKYNLNHDIEAGTEVLDGDYIFVPYPRRRQQMDAGAVVGILSGIAVILSQIRR